MLSICSPTSLEDISPQRCVEHVKCYDMSPDPAEMERGLRAAYPTNVAHNLFLWDSRTTMPSFEANVTI